MTSVEGGLEFAKDMDSEVNLGHCMGAGREVSRPSGGGAEEP